MLHHRKIAHVKIPPGNRTQNLLIRSQTPYRWANRTFVVCMRNIFWQLLSSLFHHVLWSWWVWNISFLSFFLEYWKDWFSFGPLVLTLCEIWIYECQKKTSSLVGLLPTVREGTHLGCSITNIIVQLLHVEVYKKCTTNSHTTSVAVISFSLVGSWWIFVPFLIRAQWNL
jgi:hypothetical protein